MLKHILFFLSLALLISNSSWAEGNREKVLIYAHRGGSWNAPENTMSAFRETVSLGGVDYLELDLHITRDGEIMVIHDDTVDRTTNGKGKVSEMTRAQIEQLDAGSWFNKKIPERARPQFSRERVPTLRAVVDFAKSAPIKLYIETKTVKSARKDFEQKEEEVLDEEGVDSLVVVESFDVESLKRMKAINPNLKTALLVERLTDETILLAKQISASEIAPNHESVTGPLVRRAHEAGLKVTVWTVDDPTEIKRLQEADVDGIITNRPEVVKNLIQ
ncbi:MAG: glycerophosphodiester phosphodiesterase [Acidobacteriia bacterium]|nr:glycerophosphodiester phosphodiesterase [Terriglobia bacterium]